MLWTYCQTSESAKDALQNGNLSDRSSDSFSPSLNGICILSVKPKKVRDCDSFFDQQKLIHLNLEASESCVFIASSEGESTQSR